MGMPITTYTVLADIARGRYGGGLASSLSSFNLFAFIIHDPLINEDLDRLIRTRFEHYDSITGNRFLFFTLTRPSAQWERRARGRPYRQFLANLRPTGVDDEDKSSAALSLLASLGIPAESLPCLVITDDFSSNRFVWLDTSASQLEGQLRLLGDWASHINKSTLIEEVSRRIKQEGAAVHHLGDSLAASVSDVLSFLAAKEQMMAAWGAEEHSSRVLKELSDSIREYKRRMARSDPEGPAPEEMEDFEFQCLKQLALLSLRAREPEPEPFLGHFAQLESELIEEPGVCASMGPPLPPQTFDELTPPVIEKESHTILKTAIKVHDFLLTQEDEADLADEPNDFTPAIVGLSKVFEREINLSIVHWIRSELGIELPAFFNKHQPSIQAVLRPEGVPNPRAIDFNASRGEKWSPPGMGQSELASRTLGRVKRIRGWEAWEWGRLLSDWKYLARVRNMAAHTEIVGRDEAAKVKKTLDGCCRRDVFLKLYRLKCMYRGEYPVRYFDFGQEIPF